ncbi:MAG: TlpA family protein disulfide reductase, partial [Candidatus Binatia bacterium]
MRAPWRRAAAATLGVVLLGVVGTLLLTRQDQAAPVAGGRPSGGELGSVADVTLDGFGTTEEVELASFRGTPLVLNYWASWCVFCIAEMPDF